MKSRRGARHTAAFLLLLALGWPLTSAVAGVFSVTPVRLYMTPRDRAIAVTLTNEGDTDVVLQADIHSWAQKPDGADELTLTEDLILAPPIIKLAPRARQVVRLALLKPADPGRQLTYRLVVREVPEALPQQPGVQLPIALALSMPVFITPPAAKRQVECTTSRAESSSVSLRCTNAGNAYAQIREARVQRAEQVLARFEGGSYLLPGASKAISLKGEQPLAPGAAQLTVTFDDGQSITQGITLP
ncbi:fimbrial biogenesis chaperone [Ramlibacter tataouinensis]|uniref:Pili assembly chaperone protein-like protein n=1 Tax=Ramlibacter tataouinensis (strain ATCC BAA-407 / DSM 14655 / LMG 21543 / TTB310) TaxID=365046 RepID=F5Y051_RAMTT|nr:fimbria/pilus periplasmic chaperone [Ramlibacter tataouinensis]AEG94600.1 pili assembly chaperone protein-like protein [Ramlibacter tataouinensis TTB310]